MKINDIIQETTSAGGIATVAAPLGAMQKRPNPSVFSKNKKKKTEDVVSGNFGGQADVPQLPHQEVLMAISAWEYGDTPIELSNGYVINAYEEGASADDNAWIVLDPQGNEYDSGTGSIVDVMQEFTPKIIDEGKANPMIMNRDGKEIVLTKSGDSMKPKFHLKINGKDHGTFDSEKAAMQHSARLKEADTMPEGKSPHKKGTKKYKKHMAAMHAEATLQTGGYGKPKKSRHQQKI